ncbi:AfsR/SARP family transcriptional regulator [Mesorhizobium onobrychidis]|uniref:Winged helix-turn-helix domain-containing protein n=1 Tax=Mesorhizobium onobrychidis TaxID=2775404 RepID=A0ABY5R146_9HYPH|nr:BTAD domain-containing putative transcriptional regulator [Mesorhizobium onobrychidis]UVC17053.1 winged helix-turn-helix domain-containing protein [Mesorhizobium onobrychidis]
MVSLIALGGLVVGDVDLGHRISLSPKEGELFAFILTRNGHRVKKARIFSDFWPDRTDGDARQVLNTCICEIRKKLSRFEEKVKIGSLDVTRDEVTFVGEARVDSVTFSAAVTSFLSRANASVFDELGDLELSRAYDVLSSYKGSFLEGYDTGWISPERTRLEELYLQGNRMCTRLFAKRARIEPAIESARKILEVDHFHEGAHCDLIRLLALNGQRAAALRQYNYYSDILHDELGIEPLKEAAILREKIVTGRLFADFDTELRKVGEALCPSNAVAEA